MHKQNSSSPKSFIPNSSKRFNLTFLNFIKILIKDQSIIYIKHQVDNLPLFYLNVHMLVFDLHCLKPFCFKKLSIFLFQTRNVCHNPYIAFLSLHKTLCNWVFHIPLGVPCRHLLSTHNGKMLFSHRSNGFPNPT